ncbi:MAG: hypothetical protein NVS9B4_06580 [Candidatus Acidiferrum sp.]
MFSISGLGVLVGALNNSWRKPAFSARFEGAGTEGAWKATEASPLDVPDNAEVANKAQRPVYAYSIIPGGVGNVEELRRAIARDPMVAKHYADFNLAKLRGERLTNNDLMYVSYRVGRQVFWTTKKMLLAKGEAVITDGEHVARTRCANRIAALAMRPISHDDPSESDFETPLRENPAFARLENGPIETAFASGSEALLLPGVSTLSGQDEGKFSGIPGLVLATGGGPFVSGGVAGPPSDDSKLPGTPGSPISTGIGPGFPTVGGDTSGGEKPPITTPPPGGSVAVPEVGPVGLLFAGLAALAMTLSFAGMWPRRNGNPSVIN